MFWDQIGSQALKHSVRASSPKGFDQGSTSCYQACIFSPGKLIINSLSLFFLFCLFGLVAIFLFAQVIKFCEYVTNEARAVHDDECSIYEDENHVDFNHSSAHASFGKCRVTQ